MSEKDQSKTNNTTPAFDPAESAKTVASGKFKLAKPIRDGEKEYNELTYDFNELTGWELAKAIDTGTIGRQRDAFNLSDTQALSLFAAAAAKCTEGLDATDIRERLCAADATTAIKVAVIFFTGASLAGGMRITKE